MQEAFEDFDHLGDIVDKAVTPETITGGDTNNALTTDSITLVYRSKFTDYLYQHC